MFIHNQIRDGILSHFVVLLVFAPMLWFNESRFHRITPIHCDSAQHSMNYSVGSPHLILTIRTEHVKLLPTQQWYPCQKWFKVCIKIGDCQLAVMSLDSGAIARARNLISHQVECWLSRQPRDYNKVVINSGRTK